MISIIVPHYCTPKKYFDKCIQSLLKDKDADIEVLIVDDGSPAEYIEELQHYTNDKRVKCFFEEHLGVSHARNVGIKNAQGSWLMFVDSDDFLEERYYPVLSSYVEDTNADFFFFNGYGIKNGVRMKNHYFIREHIDYAETIDMKCQLMGSGLSLGRTPEYLRCYYTLGAPVSKLIRTSFLRENSLYFDENLKFAEDTMFSLELILKSEHIYYVDVYVYYYVINQESATGRFRQGLSKDVVVFFRTVADFIEKNDLRNQLEESYYIRAFLEAQRCVRQEFYHRQNTANRKEKHQCVSSFLRQEIFAKALEANYSYMKSKSCVIASRLLKNGYYGLYMRMYNVLLKGRQLLINYKEKRL